MISKIIEEFGNLDIWVAIGDIEQKPNAIVELNEEEWDGVININARGLVYAENIFTGYKV